jgi:hypothetical protein
VDHGARWRDHPCRAERHRAKNGTATLENSTAVGIQHRKPVCARGTECSRGTNEEECTGGRRCASRDPTDPHTPTATHAPLRTLCRGSARLTATRKTCKPSEHASVDEQTQARTVRHDSRDTRMQDATRQSGAEHQVVPRGRRIPATRLRVCASKARDVLRRTIAWCRHRCYVVLQGTDDRRAQHSTSSPRELLAASKAPS